MRFLVFGDFTDGNEVPETKATAADHRDQQLDASSTSQHLELADDQIAQPGASH